MEPVISGTMIMFLRWVLTISGFSFGGASFLALRSFLIRAIGLRFSPREKRLRARLCISSTSWLLFGGKRHLLGLTLGNAAAWLK
ncbi:hypothetical protein M5D96_008645 [Drosophila gunungcola]|uniref:Uncharacterized protein n=1 Tax=Drosophila gunungcola TaxID=103775 RepID=A0A9Q0BNI0_9MUSC|nr:hypothetical protein M5D96_008645 [Drosophila gunungcola]